MAYIPTEKLLIQADAFAPRPGAAPLPAPSPYTVNLVENVRRLKLDVQRVAHVHGGVDLTLSLLALEDLVGDIEPSAKGRGDEDRDECLVCAVNVTGPCDQALCRSGSPGSRDPWDRIIAHAG